VLPTAVPLTLQLLAVVSLVWTVQMIRESALIALLERTRLVAPAAKFTLPKLLLIVVLPVTPVVVTVPLNRKTVAPRTGATEIDDSAVAYKYKIRIAHVFAIDLKMRV
jgi:hypothetical protein